MGPPPSSAGRQPHSSATSRVSSQPGRRGDQARGAGQKDPNGHLLTDMEGFTHPHSGPVYHVRRVQNILVLEGLQQWATVTPK